MEIKLYTKQEAESSLTLVKSILADLKSARTEFKKSYHRAEIEQLGLILLDPEKPSVVFPSQQSQCVYYYEYQLNQIMIYDFTETSINL